MDLEGRLLGNRYEIIKKIGNGGMATVYKAKCHVLNRYVAVKILRDEFTTDEEFIKRFSAEAQSAASITHPNIVSVYDVGHEGNLYYIVMELIQGKTLKDIIIEEGGPLPWKWSVNIAIQIASALDVAHKNNIVHRDIKPHNIIITEDGVAKVTDFGIAKAVSNSTITAFGTTIGSVHYFSPEHARGGYTDAKSDLYSLGVVMYEMLTGKVPFDADTPVSVALKHMQEEPTPPIERNPKIPPAVNDIILKAMRKDTNLRYQNATEMLNDLNRALRDPNGDFVDNRQYVDDYAATQKIPTLNNEEIKTEKSDTNKKKEGKLKTFIKEHKVLSSFIGLILLFAISLGGTLLYFKLTNPKEVAMPNVVGISKEDAKKVVEEKKLVFEVSKEEYNSEYAAGYIISQDPTYVENYNVKEGSKISVVVSLGIEEATVPKVTGMSKEDAIAALDAAKLKSEIIEEASKKIEEGYVISQETNPNTKVYAGDTVKIHVSTGVEKVTIPDVVGKPEDEANSTLTNMGLKVDIKYKEDDSKDNGIVLTQSIDKDKEVETGSSITIYVNKKATEKTCKLYVNLVSLLGAPEEKNDENTTTETKKQTVQINVKNNGNTIYSSSNIEFTKSSTNVHIGEVTGKGSVNVSLEIIKDGETTVRSRNINLDSNSTYTFE